MNLKSYRRSKLHTVQIFASQASEIGKVEVRVIWMNWYLFTYQWISRYIFFKSICLSVAAPCKAAHVNLFSLCITLFAI
jgi:hypothetical protein